MAFAFLHGIVRPEDDSKVNEEDSDSAEDERVLWLHAVQKCHEGTLWVATS